MAAALALAINCFWLLDRRQASFRRWQERSFKHIFPCCLETYKKDLKVRIQWYYSSIQQSKLNTNTYLQETVAEADIFGVSGAQMPNTEADGCAYICRKITCISLVIGSLSTTYPDFAAGLLTWNKTTSSYRYQPAPIGST